MTNLIPENTDRWLLESGPESDIVISSRARLARNLPGVPFAPRATSEQLQRVSERIQEALTKTDEYKKYLRLELNKLSPIDRRFLRESHLISTEMEKGREWREVYLSPDVNASIMVNEEDHLRMQTMSAGLRLQEVYARIDGMARKLEDGGLAFAYSPMFGYLTACPTNTGTGLRVSVMLHLVALVMTNQVEEVMAPLGGLGLVVRGSYGEHSNHSGDLFQISNEVTLGKTEEQFIEILSQVVEQVIKREREAREFLFHQAKTKMEDAVERAIGVLGHARCIDSGEAVALLSRLRLGVDRNASLRLTHNQLNRLMIDIQPAHLIQMGPSLDDSAERDVLRAKILRERINGGAAQNN